MATFKYTLKRRPEKTGFLKTGADISAAPADDSFNASSTSVSGMLTDQWVGVSGFSNAANNGNFQLLLNSTSTKITQVTPPPTHVRLSGAANNSITTPDSAATSQPGPIELRVCVAMTDWTPSATALLMAKDDGATNRDYSFQLGTGGNLIFLYTSDGSTTAGRTATSSVVVPFADGSLGWVAVTYDAAGNVKFFTSTDGFTFVQLGTTQVITSGSIHNGTSVLAVGAASSGSSPANGDFYYAELRSSIGGTIVAAMNPTLGVRGATSWIAATGETWTLNSSGSPASLLQGKSLITEAAGPIITLTGYKRGIGQQYTMETVLSKADRSNQVMRTVQKPMDDTIPETILFHEENLDDLQTTVIPESGLGQWREFLSSVSGGETFIYDKYGTIASPDNPVTAILTSESYSEPREPAQYIGGQMIYRIPFQVRVFL